MPETARKTLAEHKEYVKQTAKLSFFFARRIKDRESGKTVGEILRDHTPLFYHQLELSRLQTKWENPDCKLIMAKADELAHLPAPEFEERMFAEIEDLAMKRAEQFYPESVGMKTRPWDAVGSGSLKMDPPDQNNKRPANWANFHIANALAPRSIYADPRHLPDCFLEIMERGERDFGYDTLCTATWLNDTPRWLALFPREWHDNLSAGNDKTSWNFGNWGQLVTARGTFNAQAGQYAREHLTLKYKARSSHCSFAAMRNHLRSLL